MAVEDSDCFEEVAKAGGGSSSLCPRPAGAVASPHEPSHGLSTANLPAEHGHGGSPNVIGACHGQNVAPSPMQTTYIDGSAAFSATLPAPVFFPLPHRPSNNLLKGGRVMTDEQFEILRRQISVYSTICSQLVDMHKALLTQQALAIPSMMLHAGQQLPFDSILAARSSGRQRWTPSQIQLQILEGVFQSSNGTPSKERIKDITVELGKHGLISETNVYNWFQNRKARAKRKQQYKEGESELELEDVDLLASLRKDKRAALDISGMNGRGASSDAIMTLDGRSFSGAVSSATNVLFTDDCSREWSSIVVLIDGKPWEVPSTTLDLKGSFGETSALLDSRRQVVPTDERGFTTCPLYPGENYSLIRLNPGVT